jgi:dTMP kinase
VRESRGLFIVFEGPDGSGKTMQAKLLAAHLRGEGFAVRETREPGGTPLGNEIRQVLLNRHDMAIDGLAEMFLLAAARLQHVQDVILPALESGEIVICDRYIDSTYAYQGGGRGIPMQTLQAVQQIATAGVLPDLRILLDVPVAVGLQRRFAGSDEINRLDLADHSFHERVRDTYLDLAQQSPADWIIVNAVPSAETVACDVRSQVTAWMHALRERDTIAAVQPGKDA